MSRHSLLLLSALLAVFAWACAHAPVRSTPQAADHVAAGAAALEAGELDRAEAEYALALEYVPRLPEALNGMGVAALTRGDHAVARRWFAAAIAENEDFAEGHSNLGAVDMLEGHPERALSHFQDALAIDPGYAGARLNLARALVALDRLRDARAQYLKLTAVVPDDAVAWSELAAVEEALGQ